MDITATSLTWRHNVTRPKSNYPTIIISIEMLVFVLRTTLLKFHGSLCLELGDADKHPCERQSAFFHSGHFCVVGKSKEIYNIHITDLLYVYGSDFPCEIGSG